MDQNCVSNFSVPETIYLYRDKTRFRHTVFIFERIYSFCLKPADPVGGIRHTITLLRWINVPIYKYIDTRTEITSNKHRAVSPWTTVSTFKVSLLMKVDCLTSILTCEANIHCCLYLYNIFSWHTTFDWIFLPITKMQENNQNILNLIFRKVHNF